MNLDTYIRSQTLNYPMKFDETISKWCDSGNTQTQIFKTWHEGFIYCATLGMVGDFCIQDRASAKLKDKATYDSDNFFKQYKFLICRVLSKQEHLEEIGVLDFKTNKLKLPENIDGFDKDDFDKYFKSVVTDARKILEGYMLGGVTIIDNFYNKGGSFSRSEKDGIKDMLLKNYKLYM